MLINFEKLPDKIVQQYNAWKSARDKFLIRANKARDYFLNDVEGTGTTYTQEQYNKIRTTTNLPISFNILYPVVSQKSAILNQSKYSINILPIDDNAKAVAHIMNKIKDMILYSSSSVLEIKEAVKEYLITGISHIGWTKTEYTPDDSLFGLKLVHYPIEEVILDPNFKRQDASDMRGYFITKKVTSDVFEYFFKPYLNIINDYYNSNYTIEEVVSGVKRLDTESINLVKSLDQYEVEMIDYYDKTIAEMLIVRDPETKLVKRIFRENMFPDQFEIIASTYEILDRKIAKFVRITRTVNQKIYEIAIEETEEFPLKSLFMEWGNAPYKSKGMGGYLIPMQETMDKVLQQMIFNAMLINNGGIKAPQGSIPDELRANWEQDGFNPLAIKFYVPYTAPNGQILVPEREQMPQLPQHYIVLLSLIKEMMEFTVGITPIVTGDVKSATSEVFATNQLYQNAAMHRVLDNAQYINTIFEAIGRVLIQLLPSYIDTNKQYHFFNEEAGDFDEIQITNEQLNTITEAKFRLIAVPTEATPMQKMSTAKSLLDIAQTTQNPLERDLFIKEAYRLANIRGFEQLQEKIDTINNLQQQLKEYADKEERFNQLMKQMENRIINAELKAKVVEAQMKAVVDIEKAKIATEKDLQYETLVKSTEFDREKNNKK